LIAQNLQMNRFLFLLSFIFTFPLATFSQQTKTQTDTSKTAKQILIPDSLRHSPKKATLYSAILPGLGQAYNHKYWKIPVIYGVGAAMVYFIVDNNKQYKIYRNAYIKRLDNDSSTVDDFTNIYSDEDLRLLKNFYRRNRDLSWIATGMIYVLNIVDASVDAHLFYFNVNDDLSLHWSPTVVPGKSIGVSLAMTF
jgi:hypothetical protein